MDHDDFRYLLEQYVAESLTPAGARQLAVMLEKPEYRQALEAELQRSFLHKRYAKPETTERLDHLSQLIIGRISDKQDKVSLAGEEHRGKMRSIARLGYAAAVITVFVTGAYLFYHFNRPAQETAKNSVFPAADMAQNIEKATLTLADGTEIKLDNATNGSLAQQGSTKIVKLNSGALAYKSRINGTRGEMLYNTISTPRGGQYKIFLPDGTGVWLNAASSLRFPAAFADSGRTVEIKGEAYFEVAPDRKRPFYVKTGSVKVLVLGTSFNVNAYEDEDAVKTTLLEGSVQVTRAAASQLLRPGQQAIASPASKAGIEVQNVNTSQVMAWKNGLFNFKGAGLPAVMRQLERWYDITVKYQGTIPEFRFQGKLPRSLKLPQVLKILNEMEVKYTMEGRTLTVMDASGRN